jgi:diguanylate cyclase (GGDEF)-like protein
MTPLLGSAARDPTEDVHTAAVLLLPTPTKDVVQMLLSDGDTAAAVLADRLNTPDRQEDDTLRAGTFLLVDDDPASIQLLGRILGDLGSVQFATCGEDALRLVHDTIPDVILLDAEMPGMNGFELCRALKTDPALLGVPVIFVTSHTEQAFEVSGFDHGAADFIAKPVSAPLVVARVKTQLRMKWMADELRRIAMMDLLTGVANRRGFDEAFSREWRRASRGNEPLALLLIDVDHFKSYNDRYGHSAGDVCLRSVAQALVHSSQRPADVVARYGGEEFVILLPQTSRGGAAHVAHEILGAVESLRIVHEGSPTATHLTVSIGVGCYDAESAWWVPFSPATRHTRDPSSRPTPLDLVNAADKALYSAKRAGRAQGRLLDIADVESPESARDLSPRPCTPHEIA